MVERLFEIVYEDADLLVINKPADLVCHPTKTDAYSSLIGRVRLHLGPESTPHMINRLDRETSGLVLVAKNKIAAGEIGKLWEARQAEKIYTAIVHGHPVAETGRIEAPLGKDEASRVVIKDCVRADGSAAHTEFQVLRRFERDGRPFSLLRVQLHTGRKHQIRIHLQHAGHSLVGDKLYGGDEDIYLALVENRLTAEQRTALLVPSHALHAGEIRLRWRERDWDFRAAPEPWFTDFAGGLA